MDFPKARRVLMTFVIFYIIMISVFFYTKQGLIRILTSTLKVKNHIVFTEFLNIKMHAEIAVV